MSSYQKNQIQSNLKLWRDRLYNSHHLRAYHNFKDFFDKITSNRKLTSIIQEIKQVHTFERNKIFSILKHDAKTLFYTNHPNDYFICLCYNILESIREIEYGSKYLTGLGSGSGKNDGSEKLKFFVQNFVDPFIDYLIDNIIEDNIILYTLEKYIKRTEWFTKDKLIDEYKKASKQYEDIFEDDLRLFLFDQGIEYPFSTPKAQSGRADVIANLEKEDPIVCEIKIFDSNKKYGKNRIKQGFKQIVDYTNDYNKRNGYLVIFNIDQVLIEFEFSEENIMFPCLELDNKFYHLIIVNLNYTEQASISKLKVEKITKSELLNS